MQSLSQGLVEKPIAELALRPEVRQRLEAMLSTYTELQEQAKLLQEQADLERSKIGKLLAEHGHDKVGTETHALCWVRGALTSKLDETKLIAAGVTKAQIDAATVVRPRKDYFQIRAKSAKIDGLDE